jgi:hypothetical protein
VSDTPDETWITNGDVNSVFRAGSRIYLGGNFDQVGAATGSGVPLDPATGGGQRVSRRSMARCIRRCPTARAAGT